MRLSTIFFSLAALFVAVSATPGYSVNKRGELSSRQDCCEDPPGCGCPDTSNELKEAEGNLFAAPQIQTMSTVMTVSGDSVKRHREAAQRPEWATHLNLILHLNGTRGTGLVIVIARSRWVNTRRNGERCSPVATPGSGGASKYPGAPKQLVADDAFDGLRDRQGYSGSDVHEKNAEK
ncbi:hypothetical protein C8F04DRAFT_1180730 [Mycena alexandri]|uniref:Uncharacterized protein n=1 Tax=Mycena alexandri TaxID=1745969 RepID=A0AAD6T0C6_9AGAR|nr:hypothetical protein C8F04DRAFT_1180730 [Mycena alexandri]